MTKHKSPRRSANKADKHSRKEKAEATALKIAYAKDRAEDIRKIALPMVQDDKGMAVVALGHAFVAEIAESCPDITFDGLLRYSIGLVTEIAVKEYEYLAVLEQLQDGFEILDDPIDGEDADDAYDGNDENGGDGRNNGCHVAADEDFDGIETQENEVPYRSGLVCPCARAIHYKDYQVELGSDCNECPMKSYRASCKHPCDVCRNKQP